MLGNQGALLTLVLENNGSEDNVAFDNIVVAEPDMTTLKVGAFNDNVSQSGIKEMNAAVRINQCRTILLQKALCSTKQGQATDFQPLDFLLRDMLHHHHTCILQLVTRAPWVHLPHYQASF